MKKYLPTGNEQLSLPKLNEENIGVEDVTFLHMGCKGLIEIRGGESLPLMQPFAEVDGQSFPLKNIRWQRLGFWVPAFTCSAGPIELEGSVLAPAANAGLPFSFGCAIPMQARIRFASACMAAGALHGIV